MKGGKAISNPTAVGKESHTTLLSKSGKIQKEIWFFSHNAEQNSNYHQNLLISELYSKVLTMPLSLKHNILIPVSFLTFFSDYPPFIPLV